MAIFTSHPSNCIHRDTMDFASLCRHRAFFSTFSKEFCWLSRAKGIIGRDLKFAGYVPHYKILTGNIFGLILNNKMATRDVYSTLSKDFC